MEGFVVPPATAILSEDQIIRNGIYGVRIDQAVNDPALAVTYTGDAVGMNPLSCNPSTGICSYGDWYGIIKKLIGADPCLYLNGARSVYLKEADYTQKRDGGAADITSGNAGDVMIEFKKLYYRFYTQGTALCFEITGNDKSGDNSWSVDAFRTSGGAVQDFMYFSAYEGIIQSNKLRSLSGKTPTVNQTIGTFRTAATSMGSKYQQLDICKQMFIAGLLLLVTKTRNIQAAIGAGFTSGNSGPATTGIHNTKGLFCGSNSGSNPCKVFGIENFYGSLFKWADGFVTGGGQILKYKSYPPYNDTGNGYAQATGIYNGGGYPTQMTNLGPSLLAAVQGSASDTTGWCDHWGLDTSAGYVCHVSGSWGDGGRAGPWDCLVSYAPSFTFSGLGGRLVAC